MFEREVFIGKLVSIDTHTTRPIEIGKVSSLDHERWNDSVKEAAFVGQLSAFGMPFRSFTKGFKIIHSLGDNITVETNDDASGWLTVDGNIEIHSASDFCLRWDCRRILVNITPAKF
jgi:hypothetical protein